ncbi:MAG: phospholipase D-like domain-containing protein [Myxococcales bacterium]|nr:phospholipase D-like domain-containing protein [Myxococcales bacterium]
MGSTEVYFGGPDCARGRLRDVLAQRVSQVPAGGTIDWVTYYFRDRRLAEDLLVARRRGVTVRVTLEGRPRTPHANDRVVRMLGGSEGLGDGFRRIGRATDSKYQALWRPRLHEKLYCFSHPEPAAFIGSFNPSGDDPEDSPAVIREIGDQDRGHNLLVELRDPRLVTGLLEHARYLHTAPHGPFERFARRANRSLRSGKLELHFWPRVSPNPVDRLLREFGRGSRVRVATSHLKGRGGLRPILGLARRGAEVEVLAEWTQRRVPNEVEIRLASAGIPFRRVLQAEALPMHDKFVLIERGGERHVVFGSCNWTGRSRRLNREIAAIARDDPKLFDAFAARWEILASR